MTPQVPELSGMGMGGGRQWLPIPTKRLEFPGVPGTDLCIVTNRPHVGKVGEGMNLVGD